MSCGEDHFEPISSKHNPNWPDPYPAQQEPALPVWGEAPPPRPRNWGGKRAGAGAPKGNLNGWRHGKNSRSHKELAFFLAQIPPAEQELTRIARRARKRNKQVQSGAAELMAEVCRRLGELILDPKSNQLESNQELQVMLNQMRDLFREFQKTQSS